MYCNTRKVTPEKVDFEIFNSLNHSSLQEWVDYLCYTIISSQSMTVYV